MRPWHYQYIEYYKQDGSTLADEQSDGLAEQTYLREYYDLYADPYQLTKPLPGRHPHSRSRLRQPAFGQAPAARLCQAANCPPSLPGASVADNEAPASGSSFPPRGRRRRPGPAARGCFRQHRCRADRLHAPGAVGFHRDQAVLGVCTVEHGHGGNGAPDLRATAYDKAELVVCRGDGERSGTSTCAPSTPVGRSRKA